ncbi:MAG TPA: hypothetical protein VLV54_17460 [Thermoanaerobaculia bacterium]|nr:hypothetical protein [Thermoanaerobaculia bacterium]
MNTDSNPDRLREVLKLGDPVAQEPGLTADEFHAMRRVVLTATPEPRRQVAWLPVVATGSAVLLALALAVALGPWHRSPAPGAPAQPPVQVAAVPTPRAATPVTQIAPAVPAPEPGKSSTHGHRRPARERKTLPIHQDDAPLLTASLPVREIQFSTPGGTRVIWELAGNAR